MTTEQIKIAYPESVEMFDSFARCKAEGHDYEVFCIWGNKTVENLEGGKYYYNYEGTHIRVFPDLLTMVKWFYGSLEETAEAEEKIVNYGYSEYLSNLNDAEIFLDEKGNVVFCDFTNNDFAEEDLKKARREEGITVSRM